MAAATERRRLAERPPAIALVLVDVVIFQIGTAVSATLIGRLGPAGTSALRLGTAALVLCAVARPRLRARSHTDLRLVLAFGVTLGVLNLALYEGLRTVPLGIAMTIQFLGPLGVAVAGSRRRRDLCWVALAAAGVVLLARPGSGGTVHGVGLAFMLIAAACWAAYIVLAELMGSRFRASEGVAVAMTVAALTTLVPACFAVDAAALEPSILLRGAAAGLLLVIPYSLETEALRRMPRRVFGILMSLEPAAAALAGWIVLGQVLDGGALVAIGLVVAAGIGAVSSAAEAKSAPDPLPGRVGCEPS